MGTPQVNTANHAAVQSYSSRYLGTSSASAAGSRQAVSSGVSGVLPRPRMDEVAAEEIVKHATVSFGERTVEELLQPGIDADAARASVIESQLNIFERRAAETFAQYGEGSPEFLSSVRNLQAEQVDLLSVQASVADQTDELASRMQWIERGAASLQFAQAGTKLLDREKEVRALVDAGHSREAWQHTLGSAGEVLVDGVMAIPNRLGPLLGIGTQVVGGEAAYQFGSAVGDWSFDAMNDAAWWMYDNGLTGGLTPRNPRTEFEDVMTAPLSDAVWRESDITNNEASYVDATLE